MHGTGCVSSTTSKRCLTAMSCAYGGRARNIAVCHTLKGEQAIAWVSPDQTFPPSTLPATLSQHIFKILFVFFPASQCLGLQIPGARECCFSPRPLRILVAIPQCCKSMAAKPREQHCNTFAQGKMGGRVTHGWTYRCQTPIPAQTAVAQKS